MASHDAFPLLESTFSRAAELGLCHQVAVDPWIDGRHVLLGEQRLLSFSSCSYLGLELDPRLKRAAAEAAERFGVQFSCSRGYLSIGLYEELEALLGRIFRGAAIVSPNTTLGHLSALPVLVGPRDALLLDQRVHHSVQLAAEVVRGAGARVERVWHSDPDRLLERVKELGEQCEKIWYAFDGVYSAYGDLAPLPALLALQREHERLHLYADDAHGMSWTGKHGSGSVRDAFASLERLVIVSSLNKSFGAAGGVIVMPDRERLFRVRSCSGPLNFSGAVQPPLLAAAVASARIHLSDEIEFLQGELVRRLELFKRLARDAALPVVGAPTAPMHFIGVGELGAAFEICTRLRARGFYVNVSSFPAVPLQQSGVRIAITRHHREADLEALVSALAEEVPAVLSAHGLSAGRVSERFAREFPPPRRGAGSDLQIERASSIAQVAPKEWQECLGERVGLGLERMALLERVFGPDAEPEHRWTFHYYTVRDRSGAIVLMTLFSAALWKQDMLAPAAVSAEVEARRRSEPSYLTARVFGMGTLLTEGNHLYLDRSRDWRAALALLLARAQEDRRGDCSALALRDLPDADPELDQFLLAAGFLRMPLPPSMVVPVRWRTREEFMAQLSYRARQFQKRHVEPFDHSYTRAIFDRHSPPDAALWRDLYRLYRNVADRSLAINTYPLPERFFHAALQTDPWELIVLRPSRGLAVARAAGPCGFLLSYRDALRYVPLIIGLDYDYVKSHGLYRQCVRHGVERARELGVLRLEAGLGAEYEKSRFGARAHAQFVYLRADDLGAMHEMGEIALRLAQGSRA